MEHSLHEQRINFISTFFSVEIKEINKKGTQIYWFMICHRHIEKVVNKRSERSELPILRLAKTERSFRNPFHADFTLAIKNSYTY